MISKPIVVTIIMLFLAGSCTMSSEFNRESEKSKIEQVIHNSIEWALNKDKDLLYQSVVNDSTFFIFHPDNASTIRGFDAFKNMVEQVFMNPAFKAISSTLKDLQIHLSYSGEVAWFSCYLDDAGEWNGKPSGWEDARWTGILEKLEGKWRIAQMHFSFATDAQAEKKK